MNKQSKGISQERCVKYCSQQVQSISAEIADLKLDEYEKEYEKIDALLAFAGIVERRCENIRGYIRDCNDY